MLLPERIRRWLNKRRMNKRIKILHTMSGTSYDKTILGLELLLSLEEFNLKGYVSIDHFTLVGINQAMGFHRGEMLTMDGDSEYRPEELPKKFKVQPNDELRKVWLDTFFKVQYGDPKEGLKVSLELLTDIRRFDDGLASGYSKRFKARLKPLLKQLDVIVEHYIQLK